jgi:thiol-disulfide isomerase/thioredoxin
LAVRGAAVTVACLIALAGCGSSDPPSAALTKAKVAKELAGSPPALASLHRQSNQLLDGGRKAFEARLASLRGYPIVVNKWGSWCPPCRGEFPILQQVSARLGRTVAFLGVDSQDNYDNARKFLAKYPVSYPSYKDPDLEIAISLKGVPAQAFPTTTFYDRRGKLVYAHPAPYEKAADLIADIRRYTR